MRSTNRKFRMDSSVLTILVVLTVAVAIAQPAAANIVVGDLMYFGNFSSGGFGSFTAFPEPPPTFTAFNTFCAEIEGTLLVNGGPAYEYEVTALSLINDAPTPRALTPKAAWLYTAFLDNTLTNDRAVQYGIWHELGYTDAELGSRFNAAAANAYLTDPAYTLPSTWSGFGNVKIAQLIYVKDGTPAQGILVPEPATSSLLGLGITALLRRRR